MSDMVTVKVSVAAVILAVDLVLHSEHQPHTHIETAEAEVTKDVNPSGFLSTALFLSFEVAMPIEWSNTSSS